MDATGKYFGGESRRDAATTLPEVGGRSRANSSCCCPTILNNSCSKGEGVVVSFCFVLCVMFVSNKEDYKFNTA